MKTKKAIFIEGHIIENRHLGETCHPFCIHSVKFSNGKYAIIRADSGMCFNPGEIIHRSDCEWYFNEKKIHLYPFQYIRENESQRQLTEYET